MTDIRKRRKLVRIFGPTKLYKRKKKIISIKRNSNSLTPIPF